MADVHAVDLDEVVESEGARIKRDGLRQGDVVVVTGAARGFGRAIALRLAREGASLALWDQLADEGERIASACAELGATTAFVHCDLADPESIAAGVESTRQRLGGVYALVNNAGINLRAPALEHPLEMWRKVLDVNLTGAFLCAQAFAPDMIAQGRGAIINLASGRAIEGAPGSVSYAASKAGIIAMTKTLASEWSPHGIRVNTIIPGVSETRQPLERGGTLDELRQRGDGIPLRRVGHPEDVAGMVALLLSPDAAYITGQGLAINGGRVMLP